MSDQQQDKIFHRAQELAGDGKQMKKQHIRQALEETNGDKVDEAIVSEVLAGASISISQSGELVFFD